MKIALTGSIAVGKSSIFKNIKNIFKDRAKYIDLDEITNLVYEDVNVKKFLNENFNTENKKEISKIVFSDKEKLKVLSEFMHKKIIEFMDDEIKKSDKEYIFVDFPLLYEINFENFFDEVILVYANKEIQKSRLMKRNNLDEKDALKRINSQMDIEEKRKKTKYVINNEGSIEDSFINTLDVIFKILK